MSYNPIQFTPVVITSGQTASAAIDLSNGSPCAIYLPAAFTGTALTFTCSPTLAGTYQQLCDSTGAAITYTVAQGKNYKLAPADFIGVKYLKIVSGSSEGADRTITVAIRDFQ